MRGSDFQPNGPSVMGTISIFMLIFALFIYGFTTSPAIALVLLGFSVIFGLASWIRG